MRLLRLLTVLLLAFSCNAIFSQDKEKDFKFIWGVDNQTVFDNREGDQTYAPQQTIFFSRLSPTVGIRFAEPERKGKFDFTDTMSIDKKNIDNRSKFYAYVHRLVCGTHYIQPIGIGYKENKFVPTLYYTFKHSNKPLLLDKVPVCQHCYWNNRIQWTVSFGMIPRRLMLQRLPAILWSDSMDYYNPNIRGILLQFEKEKFYSELSLDWRSLQSAEQREAFNVNYNVLKQFENIPLFIGGNAQLNHLAKRNPAPEGEGVNDDMFVYPFVGVDFAKETVFDALYAKAGYAVSFDRCRAIGNWEVDGGLLAEFKLQWRKIGLMETLYAGNKQFPLYPMYGSLLNMGDPHYQSSLYSLTSIYSPIVSNQYVNFGAYLDFHITKEGTSCYQRVVLNINLGNVDK